MPTASLMLRLSAATTEDSTGLVSQETDLRQLAESRGLEVVAVRVDDGFSGALRDRPGFLEWLDDGRTGRADHLLAWKIDRVSRGSLQGLARFLDVLEGLNDAGERVAAPVRFLSFSDRLDSQAPGWDLQVAVLGALAKGERDAIRARVLRYRETARAQGRVVGGRRPWPFTTARRDGGGLRFVPIPERAELVRWSLDHLRASGSIGGIARHWRAETGEAFEVGRVRRILRNPNLYGATTHRGKLLRNEDGTVRIDSGQAILSVSEFADLLDLLDGRATERSASDEDRPALLARLLHCWSCGRWLYPHRPEGRTHTYRCRGGAGCDEPTSVKMSDAEDFLTAMFRELIGDRPEVVGVRRVTPAVDAEEVARLEDGVRHLDELLSGDLSDEDALSAVRSRRELRERLSALQDASAVIETERVESGRTYAEAFDAAETIPEKRAILALAFDRIEVGPGKPGHFDPTRFSFTEESY